MLEPLSPPAAPASLAIPPVRVVVVDGDRRVRAAIAALVGLADGLELGASVGHVAAALAALESTPADVLVIDPKLPDIDAGLGLVGLVRTRWPGTRIVVLTWSDSLESLTLDAGADRYLPKTIGPGELIATIETAGRERPDADAVAGPGQRGLQ